MKWATWGDSLAKWISLLLHLFHDDILMLPLTTRFAHGLSAALEDCVILESLPLGTCCSSHMLLLVETKHEKSQRKMLSEKVVLLSLQAPRQLFEATQAHTPEVLCSDSKKDERQVLPALTRPSAKTTALHQHTESSRGNRCWEHPQLLHSVLTPPLLLGSSTPSPSTACSYTRRPSQPWPTDRWCLWPCLHSVCLCTPCFHCLPPDGLLYRSLAGVCCLSSGEQERQKISCEEWTKG